MKVRHIALPLVLLLTVVSVVSCHLNPSDARLNRVLALIEAHPDSALHLLDSIRSERLPAERYALYALAYTWAQDKSGLDVADDSLIRTAFDYYDYHREDSLYPRCAYYMGKYYSLVDSAEQAKLCFEEAIGGAKRIKDIKTGYLASEKLSMQLRLYNPKRAEALADDAVRLYQTGKEPTLTNYVHLKLCQGVCAIYAGHPVKAKYIFNEAMCASLAMCDSVLISAVCQNLSRLYSQTSQYDSALVFIKDALKYKPYDTTSCLLALSSAYVNVDSTKQAKEILNMISKDNPLGRYSKYYDLLSIYISEGNKKSIKAYADSALATMENLYTQSILAKDKHYAAAIKKERERAALQSTSTMKTRLIAAIVVLSLTVITFILYVLHVNKKNAKRKMLLEKERNEMALRHEHDQGEMKLRHEQELRMMADKLHAEELASKEAQISTMRKFLLKKIDISRRIEEIKGESGKHILIDEDEWSEIETLLESVDNFFVSRLRSDYPELTINDIRLFMLLRLKMPARSLSLIYGISEKAIKQKLFLYKAKVNIGDSNTSLRSFIEAF